VEEELHLLADDRRARFDAVAVAYDRHRPRYPEAMFDMLAERAGLGPGSRVVEVGSGPGIATEGLVRRGASVVCIEPGASLAALAAAKFADHPRVEVVVSRFEDWDGPAASADLVLAATSWHWVEPTAGWAKAAEVLAPGGSLALVWTVLVGYDPPWLGRRLAQLAAGIHPSALGSAEIDFGQWGARMEDSGLFGPVATWRIPFERTLDAESFAATQSTYGSVLALAPEERDALTEATRALVEDECGGRACKREEALVFLAPRRPGR